MHQASHHSPVKNKEKSGMLFLVNTISTNIRIRIKIRARAYVFTDKKRIQNINSIRRVKNCPQDTLETVLASNPKVPYSCKDLLSVWMIIKRLCM